MTTDAATRKLTTILCADVAGYSQFMARDEEKALGLLRAHRDIFASIAGLHGGRIFNTGGDSILCEFASAVEAVRAATEIQRSVESRNAALPEDERMRFRIGVNLGDVLVHGEDLLGDGVNVAARIQAAAPVGGIILSGSVHDQITGKLDLAFQDLGPQEFKNLGRPIRTFTITQAGERALPRAPTKPSASVGGRASRARWPWVAGAALLLIAAGGGYAWQQRAADREATRFDGTWRGRYFCTAPDTGYTVTWKVQRGVVSWTYEQPGQPGYQNAPGSVIQPDGSVAIRFEGILRGGTMSPTLQGKAYTSEYVGRFSGTEFQGDDLRVRPRVCKLHLTRQ